MKSVPSSLVLKSGCPTCHSAQVWIPGSTPGGFSQLGTQVWKLLSQAWQGSRRPRCPCRLRSNPGCGSASLPGAALLVQMSTLAKHKQNSGLGLQRAFSSLKSLWLQREAHRISGMQGLGFPARTTRIQLVSFYKQGDPLVPGSLGLGSQWGQHPLQSRPLSCP